MEVGNDTTERMAARGPSTPSSKQRFGAQHAVARLLDALAPERPPARREEPLGTVQRLRTPRGCILQGTQSALTVSWFPAGPSDGTLGELQIIAWRGVVARPGAPQRQGGGSAESVWQEVLVPVENADGWAWRAEDGKLFDEKLLAQRCAAVLDGGARREPATTPAGGSTS